MIKKLKKNINKKIEAYIEKYESFSVIKKIIHIMFIAIIFEISIVNITKILTYSIEKEEKHKVNLLKYISIKDNVENIKEIQLYTRSQGHITIKLIAKNKEMQKKLNKIIFYEIPIYSFVMNYEKIFIKNNINYSIKPLPSKLAQFPLTNIIYENISNILILLFFIYMFEKQGLFGNADKYRKIKSKNIHGDFEDLIGMEEIKSDVIQLEDILKNQEKYKEFGLSNGFNILMSGPPGTGKTKIASYLAKRLDVPFIIGTGNVETGYVAGGANVLKGLFQSARIEARAHHSNTCMIFLDEAQILMGKRGKGNNKFEDDASNELLAQLDGINTVNDVNIIFIAASNFDNSNMELDEAMMRRFQKKIYFRLPNKEERKGIFEYYIGKINKIHLEDNIDYNHLAEISAKQSPAIIESIIKEAGLISINENKKIDTVLLDKAFERIVIGKTTYNKEKNQMIDIIAYHEIGHFIQQFQVAKENILNNKKIPNKELNSSLLLEIQNNISVLKISVESIEQYDTLGYVLSKEEDLKLKTKKDLENEIMSLYGGIAAEKFFFNKEDEDNDDNITVGSANDIEKVSKIFNIMINKLGMFSKNQKINLTLIDNINFEKDNTTILLSESEKLYNKAIKNIKDNQELIEYLANTLIDKKVINIIDVFSYIKSFYEKK